MRKALLTTAALVAAVFLWFVATLPPAPETIPNPPPGISVSRIVPGAFHVHSTRSDGSGDRDAIAAAAARAGLRFVAITDHGDGTRLPDPPAYLHGVLCLDGVEISTNEGHYAVIDMPAAPYPLGGESSAVAEDVKRLGGFGVAAHSDSAKRLLRWSDWNVPIDGLEWMNVDSEWRDEGRGRLARAMFDYFVRKAPALASVLDRPVATLDRWDALAARGPIVGLAGHDAHGGWSQRTEEGGRRGLVGIPSYEASFRTFAIRAVLDEELSGAADRDARLVSRALRSGRVFTAIDAIAGPAWMDFRSTSPAGVVEMGEQAAFVDGSQLTFRSSLPSGGMAALLRNGQVVAQSGSPELKVSAPGAGVYRVEVQAPRAPGMPPVPWLVTNPIYLRSGAPAAPPAEPVVTAVAALAPSAGIEKDVSSTASIGVSREAGRWRLEYLLGAAGQYPQYAALVVPLEPGRHPAFDALTFTGSAPRPMRISVQVRFATENGVRWAHSVYLSPEARTISVPFDRLVPIDTTLPRPSSSIAMSILFVADLVNAKPGTEGQFDIADLKLGTVVR